MLEELVESRGWDDLAARIRVNCFAKDPSISSSLKFLRKTDWARAKVERLYLDDQRERERKQTRNQRRASQRAYRAEQDRAEHALTTDGAVTSDGTESEAAGTGELSADSDEFDGDT